MLSFLKPAKHHELEEMLDENRVLLDEFADLDVTRQNEVAAQLAVLWQCFVDKFSNPVAFQREPRTKQDAYIAKFERVAARTEGAKHTEKGHLHYSVALMLRFLFVARGGARQQSALELSGRVASLINGARDREVVARRSHLVDALSTSLLDPPPHLNTEVLVDRPMDFHDEPGPSDADRVPENGSEDVTSRPSRPRTRYRREGDRWTKRLPSTPVRRAG
jgi:hypothetical protein